MHASRSACAGWRRATNEVVAAVAYVRTLRASDAARAMAASVQVMDGVLPDPARAARVGRPMPCLARTCLGPALRSHQARSNSQQIPQKLAASLADSPGRGGTRCACRPHKHGCFGARLREIGGRRNFLQQFRAKNRSARCSLRLLQTDRVTRVDDPP